MAGTNAASLSSRTPSIAENTTPSPSEPSSNGEKLDDAYHAFVRTDMYGTMGLGPLSFPAKLHLWIASVTILPVRIIICSVLLVLFYLICRIATLFHKPVKLTNQVTTYTNLRGVRQWSMTFFGRLIARAILFVIGFHYIREREVPSESNSQAEQQPANGANAEWATCVVSNHVSWADILYHIYAHPRGLPSFVAKKSVADLPLVGFISRCFGCVYVDREAGAARGQGGVAAITTERLKASQADHRAPLVLLFPEGTTSNGAYLLPFRTGAFLAGTPLQPVLLRYGGPFLSPAWDAIGGGRHVMLMLCQPWHTLEAVRLPVYRPSADEQKDPKLFAAEVRALMGAQGGLRLSPLTFHDKRVYTALLEGKPPPPPPHSKSE